MAANNGSVPAELATEYERQQEIYNNMIARRRQREAAMKLQREKELHCKRDGKLMLSEAVNYLCGKLTSCFHVYSITSQCKQALSLKFYVNSIHSLPICLVFCAKFYARKGALENHLKEQHSDKIYCSDSSDSEIDDGDSQGGDSGVESPSVKRHCPNGPLPSPEERGEFQMSQALNNAIDL